MIPTELALNNPSSCRRSEFAVVILDAEDLALPTERANGEATAALDCLDGVTDRAGGNVSSRLARSSSSKKSKENRNTHSLNTANKPKAWKPFFWIIKRDFYNNFKVLWNQCNQMFSCITKTHGTEDYKGFLVKILALNFTKAHFETSQINKKKSNWKKYLLGSTREIETNNMFLEATTVISKKPDHRSSSTQKTKRLNHHCNTHIIAGTIFTVTQWYKGMILKSYEGTEVVCALCIRESVCHHGSQSRALSLFRFSLYTVYSCDRFRCSLKVVVSGELLTIHIRLVSKPSQKNAVSIPHTRLIFSLYWLQFG